MTALVTMNDLVSGPDGELRVPDLVPADRLEMADHHDIRRLIKRNMTALEAFGEVSGTVPETSARGGRPSYSYLLNEPQAIYIATQSQTPKAEKVRIALVKLYMEVRQGKLQPVRAEEINLPKDRYIELLEAEIALLKGEAPRKRAKKPAPRPLTTEERRAILDLCGMGLSAAEVARRTGRSVGTVSMIRSAAKAVH